MHYQIGAPTDTITALPTPHQPPPSPPPSVSNNAFKTEPYKLGFWTLLQTHHLCTQLHVHPTTTTTTSLTAPHQPSPLSPPSIPTGRSETEPMSLSFVSFHIYIFSLLHCLATSRAILAQQFSIAMTCHLISQLCSKKHYSMIQFQKNLDLEHG